MDKRNFERYQDLPAEDLAAIMSPPGVRAAARRVRNTAPAAWPLTPPDPGPRDSLLAASKVAQAGLGGGAHRAGISKSSGRRLGQPDGAGPGGRDS